MAGGASIGDLAQPIASATVDGGNPEDKSTEEQIDRENVHRRSLMPIRLPDIARVRIERLANRWLQRRQFAGPPP